MKIGLIIALDKEMSDLFDKVKTFKKLSDCGAYDVFAAEYKGKQLYMVKSGVGEIASSAATQYLITKYNVEVILNCGICGSLTPELKLLDTVVLSGVVHYMFDTSALDDVKPGVYCEYGEPVIKVDQKMLSFVKECEPQIKTAVCASGDKFIAAESDKKQLVEDFSADVCEMEAAGILRTCLKNNVPCALIKSISDGCSSMDFNEYSTLAAKKHTQLIDKMIENL